MGKQRTNVVKAVEEVSEGKILENTAAKAKPIERVAHDFKPIESIAGKADKKSVTRRGIIAEVSKGPIRLPDFDGKRRKRAEAY